MDNCLLIQKNNRIFLLVAYPDRYHIITVNNKLDEERERKILAGDCSDVVIDEMGLTRQTILKKDLRGVAIGGCSAGDILVLYTRGSKLKYVLSDEYTDGKIDALFPGVERFQPPRSGGLKSGKNDWRITLQKESQWRRMRIVGTLLDVAGCVCSLGTILAGRLRPDWAVACMATIGAALVVYFAYPQYFSIMGSKEYKRAGHKAKVKHIELAMTAPSLALTLRSISDFFFPRWVPLLIGGVIAGGVIAAGMYVLSREVRENKSLLAAVVIVAVFVSGGILGQINHYAAFSRDAHEVYTVTDLSKVRGRRGNNYYCTVLLDSGEELTLSSDAEIYNRLKPGDRVKVYIGEGALGIEYAYLAE